MIRMFLNGSAMRGGPAHEHLHGARLIGEVRTAPRYRFLSVRDEFPGLYPVQDGGDRIAGELYELSEEVLRDSLLPSEPPELELTVIELDDASAAFAMRLRDSALDTPGLVDITDYGGWRAYRAAADPTR